MWLTRSKKKTLEKSYQVSWRRVLFVFGRLVGWEYLALLKILRIEDNLNKVSNNYKKNKSDNISINGNFWHMLTPLVDDSKHSRGRRILKPPC